MLVDVVLLRRNGLRLKPKELSSAVRGYLVVTDNDGRAMSLKRPFRQAELYRLIGVNQTRQAVMSPLFDAVLLRIEDGTITLQGTELASLEGERVVETGQIWRCRLVLPAPVDFSTR